VGAVGAVWATNCFLEKPESKQTETTARPNQNLQTQQQFPFFSEDSEGINNFSPDRSGAQGRVPKKVGSLMDADG
jgi:hypothetical protein